MHVEMVFAKKSNLNKLIKLGEETLGERKSLSSDRNLPFMFNRKTFSCMQISFKSFDVLSVYCQVTFPLSRSNSDKGKLPDC